jgi:hypothetical protein
MSVRVVISLQYLVSPSREVVAYVLLEHGLQKLGWYTSPSSVEESKREHESRQGQDEYVMESLACRWSLPH